MRKSVVVPFLRLALQLSFLFFVLFAEETHGMCIQSGFDDDSFIQSFSVYWLLDHGLAGYPFTLPCFFCRVGRESSLEYIAF